MSPRQRSPGTIVIGVCQGGLSLGVGPMIIGICPGPLGIVRIRVAGVLPAHRPVVPL